MRREFRSRRRSRQIEIAWEPGADALFVAWERRNRWYVLPSFYVYDSDEVPVLLSVALDDHGSWVKDAHGAVVPRQDDDGAYRWLFRSHVVVTRDDWDALWVKLAACTLLRD